MPSSVPSAAQLAALKALLAQYPRQRSFERQAKMHPLLSNLPADAISDFYNRKSTRPPPLKLVARRNAPTAVPFAGSPTPACPATPSQEGVRVDEDVIVTPIKMNTPPPNDVGDLVRPVPVRSPMTYSPTTISCDPSPTKVGSVAPNFEHLIKRQEEAARKQAKKGRAALILDPSAIVFGDWSRRQALGHRITAELDVEGGAFEITTRHKQTAYRLRIPLSNLAHVSVTSTIVTLALLAPPNFFQRPIAPVGQRWTYSTDFTGQSIRHSSLRLHLSDSATSSVLAAHPLIAPLILEALPTSVSPPPSMTPAPFTRFSTPPATRRPSLLFTPQPQPLPSASVQQQWSQLARPCTPHSAPYPPYPTPPSTAAGSYAEQRLHQAHLDYHADIGAWLYLSRRGGKVGGEGAWAWGG